MLSYDRPLRDFWGINLRTDNRHLEDTNAMLLETFVSFLQLARASWAVRSKLRLIVILTENKIFR